jgi:signal transduction histidine kinase
MIKPISRERLRAGLALAFVALSVTAVVLFGNQIEKSATESLAQDTRSLAQTPALVLLSCFILLAGILAGIGMGGVFAWSAEAPANRDPVEAGALTTRPVDEILTEKAQELEKEIDVRKEIEDRLLLAMEVAEAANTAKSEFLANISHELRTPMTAISASAQLLSEYLEDPHQKEMLDIINTSSKSMTTLINDLLFFAKTETGQVSIEDNEFELRKCFAEVVKPLVVKAGAKGLELKHSMDASVPDTLIGDAVYLSQIITILIDNAIKFTSNGSIECNVEIESMGEARGSRGSSIYLHCSVHDTGIGIEPEKHNEIFEVFSQADGSATRRYGGSGLGLAIARQLVELMDGRIWLESEVGRGSTFHFIVHMGISEATVNSPV